MQDWLDTARARDERDRAAAGPVPTALPLLDADHKDLLSRWARSDGARRSRAALMKEAGPAGIERAELLCDKLLRDGWIVRRERRVGGAWRWDSLAWRDLALMQSLLGVSSPRQRIEERQSLLEQAAAWRSSWRDSASGEGLDPDLLDEIDLALAQLGEDRSLKLELLSARLALLRAIADWHDAGMQGTRRDFALRARGATKALTDADWRWLESAFDLERLRIARFAQALWLAGELELCWDGGQRIQLGALQFLALPLADLCRAVAVSAPQRWWLIENRASFERQAANRAAGQMPGVALLWMPGRPSMAWIDTVTHLLRLAPAPAWISADADPAGVDIACAAGTLWQARGLAWQPHEMGVAQLDATPQHWTLNEHDRRLLASLMARPDLPRSLQALCEAMQAQGRKAEQEAWV